VPLSVLRRSVSALLLPWPPLGRRPLQRVPRPLLYGRRMDVRSRSLSVAVGGTWLWLAHARCAWQARGPKVGPLRRQCGVRRRPHWGRTFPIAFPLESAFAGLVLFLEAIRQAQDAPNESHDIFKRRCTWQLGILLCPTLHQPPTPSLIRAALRSVLALNQLSPPTKAAGPRPAQPNAGFRRCWLDFSPS